MEVRIHLPEGPPQPTSPDVSLANIAHTAMDPSVVEGG